MIFEIFLMIVSLMEGKNIEEDEISFSVRGLKEVFVFFPYAFLLFNFMIRRTKGTKL